MSQLSDEAIFDQVLRLPPDQRDAFVQKQTDGDVLRIQRIQQLVAAHDNSDSYVDHVIEQATEAFVAPVLEKSGQWIGPYKLREEIGQGGMGVVFVAERERPHRQRVALKIIKPGMDTLDVIARFSAERQALALMDHPNIAKVLDAGSTETGRPYFVMELVKGIPITEYCDRHQLTIRKRLQLFIAVCNAIQHAHQKGIIHRDIKPSNVLVTEHDGSPVPRVIDFGVAKAMNQRLTEHSVYTMHRQVVGTLQYMSPEQSELSGLDIDTRSDVYALGLLLYELITGSMPFDKTSFDEASFDEKRRIIREELPPKPSTKISSLGDTAPTVSTSRKSDPAKLRNLVRGDLDWIVIKSLEKDRNRRYESPAATARDIQRYLKDEPVEASPPSLGYRMNKFVSRHRRTIATGSAVALLMVLFGVWVTIAAANRRVQRDRATTLLSNALETASLDLGRAENSPIGAQMDWVAARASRQRIQDLVQTGLADRNLLDRARSFLTEFDLQNQKRLLAERLEEVLILGATHMDLQSWERMEGQLEQLFLDRGIEFAKQTPQEIATRIRADTSADLLSDALELWIGTKGQISDFGGTPATTENMQPWADALYAADPDPVRTGIRRLIYERKPFTKNQVDALVKDVKLNTLTCRTLAWFGILYVMIGEFDETDNVYSIAFRTYPKDLMLNLDYGLILGGQGRWQEAVRYYIRGTAIRSDVPGLWRNLGVALRHTNELARSRQALEYSIKLQDDHAPTFIDLAETQLLQDDYHSVIESTRRSIQLKLESAPVYELMGRALMGLKQYDEAIVALEQCREQTLDGTLKESVDALLVECRAAKRGN